MTRHGPRVPDVRERPKRPKRPFLTTPAGYALCVFLAIGGVLIWIEHRAHVLGVLPILLPLAICLGMHFFMHGGHGGHRGHGGDRDEQ